MRFYEAVTPLRTQLTQLNVQKAYLTEELDLHRSKMKSLMEVKINNTLQPFHVFGNVCEHIECIHNRKHLHLFLISFNTAEMQDQEVHVL